MHFYLCKRVGVYGNVYPYTVADDRVERDKKRKDNGKEFFRRDCIRKFSFMRLFCVIYAQRRFLNKHLRHSHHVFSFIPPLVSKRNVSCIFNIKTSQVQLLPVVFQLLKCCLFLIDKERGKQKTYIRVSM